MSFGSILVGMANGQVVLVTTQRLEGGSPLRVVYYVAEENPTKAEAIVSTLMALTKASSRGGRSPKPLLKLSD